MDFTQGLLLLFVIIEVAFVNSEIIKESSIPKIQESNIDYTYIAAIVVKGALVCGGTVVSKNHILTSAHCCFNGTNLVPPENMLVSVGNIEWRNGRKAYVAKCVPHEQFTSNPNKNDVGIILLDKALMLDSKVNIIKLDPFTVNHNRTVDCRVLFWKSTGGVEAVLAENATIVPPKECNSVQRDVSNTNICVSKQKNTPFCEDGSGGPLVCRSNEKNVQIGVVNYQQEYCTRSIPQLFSRISSYYTWIRKTIKKSKVHGVFRGGPKRYHESTREEIKMMKVRNS